MDLDKIREKSYIKYLQYAEYCDSLGIGLAYDYDMIKKQILENHGRKISFHKSKFLWYTYIDNKTMITCRTKEGLEDKLVEHYLNNVDGLYKLDCVFTRAYGFNAENDFLAPATLDRYKADYEKYIMPTLLANTDIRAITEQDVIKFFNDVMKQKITSKCLSNIKTVFSMIFSYARMQEGVECLHVKSVFQNLRYPRRAFKEKKPTVERTFKSDEIDIIMRSLNDENTTDLGIKLVFYTGLRVGELCALHKDDVNFYKKTLSVNRSEKVSGRGQNRVYVDELPKEYKTRDVVLSDKAVKVLEKLVVRTNGFLFPKGETHLHARVFDARLRRLCKSLNLPIYSMHDIRRTYASHMLDSDVPDSFVQSQMGHSDIKTTRQYYYYSTTKQEKYKEYANVSAI